jgi:hypothetical protein
MDEKERVGGFSGSHEGEQRQALQQKGAHHHSPRARPVNRVGGTQHAITLQGADSLVCVPERLKDVSCVDVPRAPVHEGAVWVAEVIQDLQRQSMGIEVLIEARNSWFETHIVGPVKKSWESQPCE